MGPLLFVAGAFFACSDDTQVRTSEPLPDGGTVDAPVSNAPAQKIDELLEPLRASSGLPGVSALVLRGGTVIAEGAAGVRKLGDPTPLAIGDAWYLGGDAHAMTSTLAALAVEEGKLTWSSTLGAVLPDVPMHASYTDVTLEALLGHQGGAPSVLPEAVDQVMRMPGTAQARREAGVRALLAAPSTPRSDGEANRSDAGYLIAAVMLERALGAAWEDLLKTRIFDKLGMGCAYDAQTGTQPGAAIVEPWGHLLVGEALQAVAPGSAAEPPPAYGPAGRLRCTLRDWSKFVALHLAGARREPTALLTTPSFDRLHTPLGAAFSQALGWNVVSRPWSGTTPALNHESRVPLYLALVWVAPGKDLAFLVVVNRADEIGVSAADQVVGKLVERFAVSP